MDQQVLSGDGPAPWTRSQKKAVLEGAMFLSAVAALVWDVLNGSANAPLLIWVFALAVGVVTGVLFLSWYFDSEEPDEREVLIELQSFRNAFLALFLANVLWLPLVHRVAPSEIAAAVGAGAFFALAVRCASILFYSRRSASLGQGPDSNP
jgi:hypothetical protein